MNDRPMHRVSVKIALRHPTEDKVLMTVLPDGRVGLPGGHVELAEAPDDAMRRELLEELGLKETDYRDVAQRKFWREHDGGRILLGYVGHLLDEKSVQIVDPKEVTAVVWASYDDLIGERVASVTYKEYLLELLSSDE